ncbi:hypothetical protein PsAD14_01270 [Pseudovibrio sp. Ad14]|nr:hypothetical protein PsW74_05523 [Pseudovibrio sp. W74]KZL10363.1 hypothetical protein PsAD14_01270 [Pseudovibrio sp. Ad14]
MKYKSRFIKLKQIHISIIGLIYISTLLVLYKFIFGSIDIYGYILTLSFCVISGIVVAKFLHGKIIIIDNKKNENHDVD